jgi:hypothetical protein
MACKKDNDPQPTTIQSTSATSPGNISGKVTQYNMYGENNTFALSNVTVSLDGTNNSTLTDANGNYTLTNVSAGTHTISYNRTGCGEWKDMQLSFAGNGTLTRNGYSVEKPTYTFTGVGVKDSAVVLSAPNATLYPKFFVSGNMTPVNKQTGMIVLVGTNSNMDISNSKSYNHYEILGIPANSSTFGVFGSHLAYDTTYYKIYVHTPGGISSYNDPSQNKSIITSHGAAIGTFSIVK